MLAFLDPCFIITVTTGKRAHISSSSSSPPVFISPLLKPKRRKNYLRPKLSKILAKPLPTPVLHPQEYPLHSKFPFQAEDLETTFDEILGESVFMIEPERNLVVEDAMISNVVCSTSVFNKFVLWVVGICVFQAVCSLWVLSSSAGCDQKEESLEGRNGKGKRNHSFNGKAKVFKNVVSVEDSDLEDRICNIRAMAEDVRRRERDVLKVDDNESSLDDFEDTEVKDGFGSFRVRSGIEKEVDERLLELKNELKSEGSKSLLSYLKKFEKIGDREQSAGVGNVKDVNKTKLLFSKKLQFRSPTIDLKTKPKGFQKLNDGDLSIGKFSSSGKKMDVENNGSPQKNAPKAMQMYGKKLEDEIETTEMAKGTRTEPSIGSVKETSQGKNSIKGEKLRKSKRRVKNFAKTKQVKSHGIKSKPEKEIPQSDIPTASWWLNIPYFLTIYIRGDSDTEGEAGGGFFTLQLASSDQQEDHDDSSYGVAFEDHSDANNFCFILEAFFQDVGDFGIDIIPLSKEELKEALESHNMMKMIVVKKRQIKFYAGQPLTEAETALRSLIALKQVVDINNYSTEGGRKLQSI